MKPIETQPSEAAWVRATAAALCSMLVGIGLARFAYAPLMPAIIGAGWFSPSDAAYLGVANLAGYLAGALIGGPLTAHLSIAVLLRSMMLLVGLSFIACAEPGAFSWFFGWRFISGVAGGVLMVLAAPFVLTHVPVHRRGLASGVIFTGVGLGIAASGTLTPALLVYSLTAAWCVLGSICVALAILTWKEWPAAPRAAIPTPEATGARMLGRGAWALFVSYGLVAAALVPHMIFLVDFAARGLGLGVETGSAIWVLFGIGAVSGPILAGRIADCVGFGLSLRCSIAVLLACNLWLAIAPDLVSVCVSSLMVGSFVPGITALALGRLHQLLADPLARRRAWSIATIAFAILQAVAAYALAYLFSATAGAYAPLFAAAATAALFSLLAETASGDLRHGRAEEAKP